MEWRRDRLRCPLRWVCSALLLAVVATGCLRGEVDVTVRGDGSGQIVVEVFPTADVMQAARDVDIESLLGGSFTGVDGFEFDSIERDDREGYRVVVPFDDYRQVVPVLLEGGTVAGERVVLFSSFALVELPEDTGWQLEAQINPIGQVIDTREGGTLSSLAELLTAAGIRSGGSGLDLSISLPGKVVSSNANRVDGGTATWVLDRPDAPTRLTMRTEPKPLLSPVQLVVVGAAIAVLLGGLLALFGASRPYQPTEGDKKRKRARRAKKRRASGVPESGWAPPPTGAPATSVPSARPEPLPPLSTPLSTPMSPPGTASGAPVVSDDSPPAPPVESPWAPDDEVATGAQAAAPVPGWYADPHDQGSIRWWDGSSWTDQTRPAPD